MSNQTITAGGGPATVPKAASLSPGLFIIFALMLAMAVVSVAYAVSMIGFIGDDGYFLAYASLCTTVPIVAAVDQYLPFLIAAGWAVCLWLGLRRSAAFRRATNTMALVSIFYAAADVILGPFTFRVGPADFNPDSVACGRWPRAVTDRDDLQVMQLDWLNLPISTFGLSLIVFSMTIFIYLKVSRRAAMVYRPR